MTAYIFDRVLEQGVKAGQVPAKTIQARTWFREQARVVRTTPNVLINEGKSRLKNTVRLGEMYAFFYNAKLKETLNYFDRFPLVFPFKRTNNGFYGINMHYLDYKFRAKLMDSLYDYATNEKFDETTRLRLNYSLLESAARFKYFRPCVKQYLNSHVQSRFLKVEAKEWDIALFLPVERFVKVNTPYRKSLVWKDSRGQFNGI